MKKITLLVIALIVANPALAGANTRSAFALADSPTHVKKLEAQVAKLKAQNSKLKKKTKKQAKEVKRLKIKCLNHYLSGTKMAGHGSALYASGTKWGVKPQQLAAQARIESGCGARCRSYNAYGIAKGAKRFKSFKHATEYTAKLLATSRYYKGKTDSQKLKTFCPEAGYGAKVRKEMKKVY